MNRLFNRAISILSILATLFCLIGCEATNTNLSQQNILPLESNEQSVKLEEVFNREEVYPFAGGCTVDAVVRVDDTLLIQGYNEETPIFSLANFQLDEFGCVKITNFSPLTIESRAKNNEEENIYEENICGLTAGGDNCFYVLIREYLNEFTYNGDENAIGNNYQEKNKLLIMKISPDGTLLDECEFDRWIDEDVLGILVNSRQEVVIYGQKYIASFQFEEPDEVALLRIDEQCSIMTGALWHDDIVFPIWGTRDSYYVYSLKSRDLKPAELSDSSELREVGIDGYSKCQGLAEELILNEGLAFWICETLDNCQLMFRWNYTVFSEFLPYVCRVGERSFVCSSSEKDSLSIISMIKKPLVEKSVVNVALINMNGNSAAVALNRQNIGGGNYYYEMTEYDESNLDKLITNMNMGKSPDLIIFEDSFQINPDMYEDLYTFLDADQDISRESFIPNYLEALSVNGKLCEIWPSVAINSIVARNSDLSGKNTLTASDYMNIINDSDKYKTIFGSFMTKENLMRWVSILGISAYVERDKAICNFDNESFAELLSLCEEIGADNSATDSSSEISETLLLISIISSVDNISSIYNILGEDYTFVGFPLNDDGKNFFSCGLNGKLAIPKSSKNKEGAWAFISSMLQLESQLEIKYYLPVNKKAFMRRAEASLNPTQIDLLLNLVEKTEFAENTADSILREIIMSSGQAYIAGDKSLEETIALIQSRASIYMAEQYG